MDNYQLWQLEKYGNILPPSTGISYPPPLQDIIEINLEFNQQNPK